MHIHTSLKILFTEFNFSLPFKPTQCFNCIVFFFLYPSLLFQRKEVLLLLALPSVLQVNRSGFRTTFWSQRSTWSYWTLHLHRYFLISEALVQIIFIIFHINLVERCHHKFTGVLDNLFISDSSFYSTFTINLSNERHYFYVIWVA